MRSSSQTVLRAIVAPFRARTRRPLRRISTDKLHHVRYPLLQTECCAVVRAMKCAAS